MCNPTKLSGRQRVERALAGLPAPHPAVGPLAVHYCARVAGRSIRAYTSGAGTLAACVLRYFEVFQPDAVWVSADTWVNAQAMGAAVDFPGDDQPMCGVGPPRIQTPGDIDRIPEPDPHRCGRWPQMLDAVRRIRQQLGDAVFLVACFDQFPFSLACALMGVQPLMVRLTDDRPFVTALLERCSEYTAAYARALANEGADMLSGGDSPAGLIGPSLYRAVALPFERAVVQRIKDGCRQPVSLHICGDATGILADMAASGADVLELDQHVDLATACRAVGPKVAIWGNLDPVGLLSQGDPAAVSTAAWEALATVRRCGHPRFVLSSGCTLAMETPPENLQAMIRAARSFETAGGWPNRVGGKTCPNDNTVC